MRNKTIRVAPDSEEGKKYLARCLSVTEPVSSLGFLRDKTVLGDCFAVLPHLPSGSVDLVIADPPYNLDKRYGDTAFHRMDMGNTAASPGAG